jgi:hypothetical protein
MTRTRTNMNWSENLVARLSTQASQVLLSVLLARQGELSQPIEEFAISRTGLSKLSVCLALSELEAVSLLLMIVDQPGKVKVSLVYEESEGEGKEGEYAHGTITKVTEETDLPSLAGATDKPLLVSPIRRDAEGVRPEEVGWDGDGASGGLLGLCKEADRTEDRSAQVVALKQVWDAVFPVEDYPYQRMTQDAARKFLSGRTAEYVGQVILDAPAHATERIKAPRSYIEAALAREDAHRLKKEGQGGDGVVIDDDLRRLTELGRRQFGGTETKT